METTVEVRSEIVFAAVIVEDLAERWEMFSNSKITLFWDIFLLGIDYLIIRSVPLSMPSVIGMRYMMSYTPILLFILMLKMLSMLQEIYLM